MSGDDITIIIPGEVEVEPPSEEIWRDLPQSRQEGFWFTVDSLAAAMRAAGFNDDPVDPIKNQAAAIIEAAKEVSDE